MARKEKTIIISDRDGDLHFLIKEMSAVQLESWIIRGVLVLANAGLDTPDKSDLREAGEYLAQNWKKLLSSVDYEKAKPLLDEMLGCCYRVIDNARERCTPESVEGYIMDVATLIKLRMEALTFNLGFIRPEGESNSGSPEKPAIEMQ